MPVGEQADAILGFVSRTVMVPQLTGRLVHLAALSEDHVEGLLHAADDY